MAISRPSRIQNLLPKSPEPSSMFGGLGFRLGTAPTQQQPIIGVILRALYIQIITSNIQLFLGGGSTQALALRG